MADAKSTKQKNAGASGNTKKQTAPKKEKSSNPPSADWAQTVLNQLVEAQKTWFENASQQNAMLIETVNKMSAMRQTAPTEALSDWFKQGIEGFIEAQKRWSEIAVQQSEQVLQAIQSNTNFSDINPESSKKSANQGIESLVKMRNSWLDFVTRQNTQLVNAMKDTLKIDDSSPTSALVDFAQQAVNNYIEVQKRWLDLAIQLPFSGAPDEQKK
ncbi:MAG: hypothetical protein LH614_15830 [Pyrinomonadaceae bacterium]|nr:hypothetical protein [Pyrinomonadaceae bacterium]